MELKNLPRLTKLLLSVFLLFFLIFSLKAAPITVKVILDNASIKATRAIGGKTLIQVPLNTILDAVRKQGEWYRVTYQGVSGYIHEMNVEEVSGAELAAIGTPGRAQKTQAEIVAEIGVKMNDSRIMIRQEKDFEKAIASLRPLIARVFTVTDHKKQRELATEIFLWIGFSFASKGDALSALTEFKNMFEVDYAYAKGIIRLIPDPRIVALIQQSEKEFMGLVTEYSLEITTNPKEATIKINGKEIGLSPEIYRTTSPEIVIEIEKKGYKPIKEEVFITKATSKKEYTLERAGRDLEIKSTPTGASVYLDGKDTKKVTNCVLPSVFYGTHKLKVTKENYLEWESDLEIEIGEGTFPLAVALTPIRYQYVHKWGAPATKVFDAPSGVAVDKEDNIYVIGLGAKKVQKISSDWKFQTNWGQGGKEFRVLKNPGGIAVDSKGNIFVSDTKNHCVMRFDKTGKYNRRWGTLGNGNHMFNIPLGIAVDSNDNVYVVDSGNNRVKKYSRDGVLKKIWGKQGSGDGDFVYPAAIAVNQKNEVLVTDRTRVQKFSSEGVFISSWGKLGSADGALKRPMGIFVDKNNFIYVADSGNDRIQKFDETGKFIMKLGSTGTGIGQMVYPAGIVVDSRGYVFVVERDNNRLQLFGVPTQSKSKSN